MSHIRARVTGIEEGPRGPFAFAVSDQIEGSITFSLIYPVWKESRLPPDGAVVILSELINVDGKWRAMSARFLTPADNGMELA